MMHMMQPTTHRRQTAGRRLGWILIGLLLCSFSVAAHAGANVSSQFPPSITVEGKVLKRIGSGLREFLFIDIYSMGAYSLSGGCDPGLVVSKDEAKYLRLVMQRDIPRERLASNLKSSLVDNLSKNASPELKRKVDVFISYLKADLKEGTMVEIVYLPGKGTRLKQNGRPLGPYTSGKDFADVVWRAYFGPKTCCSGLKSDIVKQCKAGK